MLDKKQKLASEVEALAQRLDGKQFAIIVWDGDAWGATVSYGIDKEHLKNAGKFWLSEAEKLVP